MTEQKVRQDNSTHLPHAGKFLAALFALHVAVTDVIHKCFLRHEFLVAILPKTSVTPRVRRIDVSLFLDRTVRSLRTGVGAHKGLARIRSGRVRHQIRIVLGFEHGAARYHHATSLVVILIVLVVRGRRGGHLCTGDLGR